MEYKRIAKDSLYLFVGRFGTSLFGLIILMILTRLLTQEQMGSYSLFLTVVNIGLILTLNWSHAGLVRFGRSEFVKKKTITTTFWTLSYLIAPFIIVAILLAFIFQKQITAFIGFDASIILLAVFLMQAITTTLTYALQSIDNMKKSSYVLFVQKFLFAAFVTAFLLKLLEVTLHNITIALAISFLITNLLFLATIKFRYITPIKVNKKKMRKIWRFCWPQLIGFSGLYIINYIDLYVIRAVLDLQAVGIYSIAYNGFTMVTGFLAIINTVFMPLAVEYREKKKPKYIRKYIKLIPMVTIAWIVITIIGVILAPYIIQFFFSAKYIAAIPSFTILLFASIFFLISASITPILNAFDLTMYQQGFNLAAAAINIILDVSFVKAFGIKGAAYATLISFMALALMKVTLIYRLKKKVII